MMGWVWLEGAVLGNLGLQFRMWSGLGMGM